MWTRRACALPNPASFPRNGSARNAPGFMAGREGAPPDLDNPDTPKKMPLEDPRSFRGFDAGDWLIYVIIAVIFFGVQILGFVFGG